MPHVELLGDYPLKNSFSSSSWTLNDVFAWLVGFYSFERLQHQKISNIAKHAWLHQGLLTLVFFELKADALYFWGYFGWL